MKIKLFLKKIINYFFNKIGYQIINKKHLVDYYLHEYSSYNEYRDLQILHNKRKIHSVWADEKTLSRVVNILLNEFSSNDKINGICHGSRNGFEQNFLRDSSIKINAIGTDISDNATNFPNSFQWDFHDTKKDWTNKMEFIYTNSLDQSWKPKTALKTWLSQLKPNGLLIIEHTELHGTIGTSEMDPFGVKPTVMPYVLTMWFGSQISIEHTVEKKANKKIDAWLFVVRKNKQDVLLKKN